MAQLILNPRGPYRIKIKKDTPEKEHIYHLILARLGAKNNEGLDTINPGLFHYSQGVSYLFRQQDSMTRESFAMGMFMAARLAPEDYQRMKDAGVPVTYDQRLDASGNARALAKEFIEMDLRLKEQVLNVGLGDKAGLSEYETTNVYFNLGFYLTSEYKLDNKDAPRLYMNPEGNYQNLFRIKGYHTLSNQLLV